jgi:hypothetical protein
MNINSDIQRELISLVGIMDKEFCRGNPSDYRKGLMDGIATACQAITGMPQHMFFKYVDDALTGTNIFGERIHAYKGNLDRP